MVNARRKPKDLQSLYITRVAAELPRDPTIPQSVGFEKQAVPGVKEGRYDGGRIYEHTIVGHVLTYPIARLIGMGTVSWALEWMPGH